MVLHFVKEEKIEASKALSLVDNAEDIIETLMHMGWITHEDGHYKLVANMDIISYYLANMGEGKLDIPFIGKIYEAKNAYMLVIPMYLVRTFNIKHGDLLVINIDGVRVSGTVSGRKKLAFYIRKKYWAFLEDVLRQPKEYISCVLERVYHAERGVDSDQLVEENISEEEE